MTMKLTSLILFAAAALLPAAVAHPADESVQALAAAKRHTDNAIRSFEACQNKLLRNRELHDRRFAKRKAWINEHAERRGVRRRSVAKRGAGLDLEERQASCVLAPEVTICK